MRIKLGGNVGIGTLNTVSVSVTVSVTDICYYCCCSSCHLRPLSLSNKITSMCSWVQILARTLSIMTLGTLLSLSVCLRFIGNWNLCKIWGNYDIYLRRLLRVFCELTVVMSSECNSFKVLYQKTGWIKSQNLVELQSCFAFELKYLCEQSGVPSTMTGWSSAEKMNGNPKNPEFSFWQTSGRGNHLPPPSSPFPFAFWQSYYIAPNG